MAMANTVFFFKSKLFGSRGVDEHRNLSLEQFEMGNDQNGSYLLLKRPIQIYKGKNLNRFIIFVSTNLLIN